MRELRQLAHRHGLGLKQSKSIPKFLKTAASLQTPGSKSLWLVCWAPLSQPSTFSGPRILQKGKQGQEISKASPSQGVPFRNFSDLF